MPRAIQHSDGSRDGGAEEWDSFASGEAAEETALWDWKATESALGFSWGIDAGNYTLTAFRAKGAMEAIGYSLRAFRTDGWPFSAAAPEVLLAVTPRRGEAERVLSAWLRAAERGDLETLKEIK